ncbi:MAG TPA: hypothetical protein VGY55_19745 [Pirellulales bacterium]|jgi:hypothetical protein|nr:hypothetical protein [Pirellulales bacterium]
MSPFKNRSILAISCIALTLALPAETQACWLTHCFAPAAPAAPALQQVNYVPQTSYRTVYSPVAVTSYRPITTADPCTGCPVTSLAPVTTYVQRPVVVPYTTYRPVITTVMMPPVAPACPCSTCSSCATGACAAPTLAYYAPPAVAAPAPSCGCGASAAGPPTSSYYAPQTASYYAPATTRYYAPQTSSYYAPAPSATTSYYAPPAAGSTTTYYSPSYSTTAPSAATTNPPISSYYNGYPSYVSPGPVNFGSPSSPGAGASTGAPTLPNSGNSSATGSGSTQVQKPADSSNPPPEAPKQAPIPDSKDPAKANSTGILKYSEPEGRTTSMPIMRPWSYTAVNWPRVTTASTVRPAMGVAPAAEAGDGDAWHAAR